MRPPRTYLPLDPSIDDNSPCYHLPVPRNQLTEICLPGGMCRFTQTMVRPDLFRLVPSRSVPSRAVPFHSVPLRLVTTQFCSTSVNRICSDLSRTDSNQLKYRTRWAQIPGPIYQPTGEPVIHPTYLYPLRSDRSGRSATPIDRSDLNKSIR